MLLNDNKIPKQNPTLFFNQARAHLSTVLDKIETIQDFEKIMPTPEKIEKPGQYIQFISEIV